MINAAHNQRDVVEKGVCVKTRDCPRCQRHSLFQTGAFWACGVCSYAITQAALFIDQADAQVRNRRRPTDSQTGSHTTL